MNYKNLLSLVGLSLFVGIASCEKDEPQQTTKTEQEKPEVTKPEEKKQEEPKDKETPQEPKQPETPATPKEGEKPATPQDPKQPETPATPKEGEKPATPQEPKTPEKPATPKEGEKPAAPQTPKTPETPSKPKGDDKPAAPKEPEKPNTPAVPQVPPSPGVPKPVNPLPTEQPAENVKRNMLLVDFTGQNCAYCYSFLGVLDNKHKNLGDRVAIVAMHGLSYRSEELFQGMAGQYFRHFGLRGTPTTIFNNLKNNREGEDEMLAKPDVIDAKISSQLNGNEISLRITPRVRNGQQAAVQDKSFNLLIWVTEDGVVAPQVNSSGSWIHSYVHNHVFRGVLGNQQWGELCPLNQELVRKYSLPTSIKDKSKARLVVLFLDSKTYEAIDVSTYPLTGR